MNFYFSVLSIPVVYFGIKLMLVCNRLCLDKDVTAAKKVLLTAASLAILGPVIVALLGTAFMGILPMIEDSHAIAQHWPYSIAAVVNVAILSVNFYKNRELLFWGRL